MIKAFLKQNISSIALVFSSLVMFAIVFGLFQLGWKIYWITAGLILLLLFLYLIYQSIHFQREKNLEDQVNELVETLNDERNNNRLMRQDIEEYFLLWVHQIKTPITASYLLLAEEDFENKSLLQQEVLKIENYSNMRSEEHTSELQSRGHLVCRLLLEKKKKKSNVKYLNDVKL